MSRVLTKQVLDSIDRAMLASQHAERISGQAREAFAEESKRLPGSGTVENPRTGWL